MSLLIPCTGNNVHSLNSTVQPFFCRRAIFLHQYKDLTSCFKRNNERVIKIVNLFDVLSSP